jgi:hypothetical protein
MIAGASAGWGEPWAGDSGSALETRVDRLALEREHTEHAFVHAVQRSATDEALERFDAECELAQCQRSLGAEAALAQPLDLTRIGVLGSASWPEQTPDIAVLKAVTSATERNDEAAYGRSLTYSASANPLVSRPRRTSPTGSIDSSSAAVQRSSLASG